MAILPLRSRYPFDPSGNDSTNLVTGETHEIPIEKKRIIVPKQGAFYRKSLIVQQRGDRLVENRDYYLGGFYQEATAETGLEANMMIVFADHIQGEVTISYQVVGGEYSGTFQSIQEYVNLLLVDPRKTRWDDILDKPDFYVPLGHYHDINDVYGLNYLIPVLESIRNALEHVRTKELRRVNHRIALIRSDVTSAINDIKVIVQEIKELGIDLTEKFNRLTQSFNTLKQNFEAFKTEIRNEFGPRITANEKAITIIQSNINTIDNQLTDLTSRVQSLESRATKIEAKNKAQDALLNEMYDSSSHLLKKERIPISDDFANILTVDDKGLTVNLDKVFTKRYTLYVDSVNGDDNNPGTFSAPLRTVDKALLISHDSRVTSPFVINGAQVTILLRSNQTYTIGRSIELVDTELSFRFYGEVFSTDRVRISDYATTTLQFNFIANSVGSPISLKRSIIRFSDIHVKLNPTTSASGYTVFNAYANSAVVFDHFVSLTDGGTRSDTSYLVSGDCTLLLPEFWFLKVPLSHGNYNIGSRPLRSSCNFFKNVNNKQALYIVPAYSRDNVNTSDAYYNANVGEYLGNNGVYYFKNGDKYYSSIRSTNQPVPELDPTFLRANTSTIRRQGMHLVGGISTNVNPMVFATVGGETVNDLNLQRFPDNFRSYTNMNDPKLHDEAWGTRIPKLVNGMLNIGEVYLINKRYRDTSSGDANKGIRSRLWYDGEYVQIDSGLNAETFNSTSDKRLKKNIVKIEKALDKVDALTGYTFTYKGTNHLSGGLMAQDVQKVLPQLIFEDASGMLSMNYNGIVGLLVEAVKELRLENELLQQRIELLEKKG